MVETGLLAADRGGTTAEVGTAQSKKRRRRSKVEAMEESWKRIEGETTKKRSGMSDGDRRDFQAKQ